MVVRGLTLLAVVLATQSSAAPCAFGGESPIAGFQVLPADGSRVPRSTALWLRADQSTRGALVKDPSAVALFDERGKRINLSTTTVQVTGVEIATLVVLRPTSTLEASTNYRLELAGEVISKFVTSDEIDMKPPELPKARVSDVKQGVSCVSPSQVTVQLETPGEINFLISESAQMSSMPIAALAVSNGSSLVASSLPAGMVDLRVVSFDLSGNMAMGSEKLTTYLAGAGGYGCSTTAVGPLIIVALAALIRRRR